MPLSELVEKWTGMNFDIAAEEMRRLQSDPTESEKLNLYGLYKQAIHGDMPKSDLYPIPYDDEENLKKYRAWETQKGKPSEKCKEEYVRLAEEMIRKYKRRIERTKWNSEVWSVDY